MTSNGSRTRPHKLREKAAGPAEVVTIGDAVRASSPLLVFVVSDLFAVIAFFKIALATGQLSTTSLLAAGVGLPLLVVLTLILVWPKRRGISRFDFSPLMRTKRGIRQAGWMNTGATLVLRLGLAVLGIGAAVAEFAVISGYSACAGSSRCSGGFARYGLFLCVVLFGAALGLIALRVYDPRDGLKPTPSRWRDE